MAECKRWENKYLAKDKEFRVAWNNLRSSVRLRRIQKRLIEVLSPLIQFTLLAYLPKSSKFMKVPWISSFNWFPSKQTFSRVLIVSTGTSRIFKGSVLRTVAWIFPRSVCRRQCGLRAFNSIILFILLSETKIDAWAWNMSKVIWMIVGRVQLALGHFIFTPGRQQPRDKKSWSLLVLRALEICIHFRRLLTLLSTTLPFSARNMMSVKSRRFDFIDWKGISFVGRIKSIYSRRPQPSYVKRKEWR